jgi:phospholipid transport system transporter-binding protein
MHNNKPLTITQQDAHCYHFAGDLSFATIDKNTIKALSLSDKINPVSLDLKQINKTDSAGLALLLEWIKIANQQHTSVQLLNIPEQLLAIARLSGLDTMLQSSTL